MCCRGVLAGAVLLLVFGRGPLPAEELPQEAVDLLSAFEEDAEAMRFETERKIEKQKLELISKLKELQDQYTRAAKLDEAVAIRNRIRDLQDNLLAAEPGPINLTQHSDQVGKRMYFRVTGSVNGSVYGTDFYTADSTLATAAVHCGALKDGETGIVRVTIYPGRPNYVSSTQNGITSNAWSNYSASYQVERLHGIDLPVREPKPGAPTPPGAVPGSGPGGETKSR